MTDISAAPVARGFSALQYLICLKGIVWREALRFLHQRERFVSALVRPLVWLFIFAAGFRSVLGVSVIPPYETYVLYEVYITPGLMAMIQLFNGMQSSMSMVYDREMGNMRTLLVSPLPRWYLLVSKLIAGTAVSVLQVYAYLVVAWLCHRAAGAHSLGPDARRARHAAVLADQAARKFLRHHEFCHIPDVLCLLCALPAVARAGGQPLFIPRLSDQPFHPRNRTDPLHVPRADRLDGAGGGDRLHAAVSRRRDCRL
jgi:ABC-2 type transporter